MIDPMEDSDAVHQPTHERLGLPLANDDTETDEDAQPTVPVRIFTPPPHIAARFYRTAQARRKGSAVSSRRNSISSTHSRSSHGYATVGATPQSKHVAQHLRRASILADRKARLADRAAHAEQVRLRAAMAKAAVRDISLSEERAQAAAQTREKNLADITAACAEEVKRAKAIAESIKEKRELRMSQLRQQMQDRLDEAERRREELRRNNAGRSRSRGLSLKQAEAKRKERHGEQGEHRTHSLTKEEAASRILRWWRTAQRRKAVADFQQLGLTVDGVRDTSFETVVELLGQDQVLQTTGKVLRICGVQEGKTSAIKEIVAVRAFLSAFLILGHPTQVLSTNGKDAPGHKKSSGSDSSKKPEQAGANGNNTSAATSSTPALPLFSAPMGKDDLTNPQLQELVAKARDLLICFETILSQLAAANKFMPPVSLAGELAEAYDTFYDAFIAWKARDASALVDVMIRQFVELDAIWQTVKDTTDSSVSDTYRESIQQNQLLLMVRIKKLAGSEEGKKKVFLAVRRARKAKTEANKKAAAASTERRPREAHTIETAMGNLSGRPSGPSNKESSGGPSVSADASLPFGESFAGMRAETPSQRRLVTVEGLPPMYASVPRFVSHPLPENRVVVHELAINREFRVSAERFKRQQAQCLAPVFHRMRRTMGATNAKEQEEHFNYLLSIAETMRTKLQRMTPAGKKMHQFIGELLDTDVARRQFAVGSFSYERFFASMGQLLPKLCAPFRDAEVEALVGGRLVEGDYVDRLEALQGFIDVMLTDHVNFLISVAAPELLLSATKYEATRFGEMVQQGSEINWSGSRLPVAMTAWQQARSKVLAEASKRDPEGINHPRSRPTATQLYVQMLVDVFTQIRPAAAATMPEMLALDHERALRWGALTRRLVTVGAILLQCKNLLKRDVRAPWKTEAQRVMVVLEKAEAVAAEEGLEQGDADWSHGVYISDSAAAARLQTALASPTVVDGVMAALESGRSMPAAARVQLRSLVQRTLAASGRAATAGDDAAAMQEPVMRLLLHRLRSYLVARLAATSTTSSTTDKARAVNERLASLGLAEFVDRVREMTDEMGRVGAIDRETHGVFWEEVAAEVETQEKSERDGKESGEAAASESVA